MAIRHHGRPASAKRPGERNGRPAMMRRRSDGPNVGPAVAALRGEPQGRRAGAPACPPTARVEGLSFGPLARETPGARR